MPKTIAQFPPKRGTASRLGLRRPPWWKSRHWIAGDVLARPADYAVIRPIPTQGETRLDGFGEIMRAMLDDNARTTAQWFDSSYVWHGLVARNELLMDRDTAIQEAGEWVDAHMGRECCDVHHHWDKATGYWLPGCDHLGRGA